MKNFSLGNRMKEFYENITRYFLPRRTYTLIRIDGKAFHTYTRGLVKPFDDGLITDMDETAKYLCENIQGSKFAFVQSDEISILLTDFDNLKTSAWFDGNIQKIASVSASLATAKFNLQRMLRSNSIKGFKLATFDSRTWTIPSRSEVENYFIFRQNDATINSISSVAQSVFSTKELHCKNTNQMQDMLFLEKNINWNDLSPKYKRGRLIVKENNVWTSIEPPIFKQNWGFLENLIPVLE